MTFGILVIDDEPALRDAFALALEETGYAVDTAASGEAGLAKAVEIQPDLVFLDLKMPGMDGVEVLRRMNECCPRTAVYIVTAFVPEYLDELAVAARQGLRFGLAQKPLSGEQIRLIAKGMLEQPQVV